MKELVTERLILRKYKEDDFAAVHDYAKCPENIIYMLWGPNSEQDTRDFIDREIAKADSLKEHNYAVVLKDNGRVIGGCGLTVNGTCAELGWIIHRDYWKRGYCTELAEELIRLGFEELQVRRIIASCDAENIGSYRVMEKAGMRREALFLEARPANRLSDKEYGDELIYAVLKSEWEAKIKDKEMNENIKIVREHYDSNVSGEWERIADRPEFLLTCRMIDRYIKSGDKVLDIGGGPGRYSLYLADKGCDVTLFDLSPGNIKFAKERAAEQNLSIKTVAGDAREADKIIDGRFEHILLMGPMYHLLEEPDRISAVNAALNLLKPGGMIYISFINLFAVMLYYMKQAPHCLIADSEKIFIEYMLERKTYAGDAFTKVVFTEQSEILPFMSRFPLEKLHLFGQESIMSPCENNIMSQPPEVIGAWLDLCEKICEREDLLNWSEHLMYIGRKI